MTDDVEVPFPDDPECLLTWEDGWPDDATGWITFVDPKPNAWGRWHRTSIPVTKGPTRGDHPTLGNVWHFDLPEPGVLVTSPSIHAVGCWHTPNPTRWRLVDNLTE